jgi:hypothetical protein
MLKPILQTYKPCKSTRIFILQTIITVNNTRINKTPPITLI